MFYRFIMKDYEAGTRGEGGMRCTGRACGEGTPPGQRLRGVTSQEAHHTAPVRVLAECNPQPPSPPLPGGQGLGLKVPALQSHVVFLVISPILTLPRDPKLSHLLIVGTGLLKKSSL